MLPNSLPDCPFEMKHFTEEDTLGSPRDEIEYFIRRSIYATTDRQEYVYFYKKVGEILTELCWNGEEWEVVNNNVHDTEFKHLRQYVTIYRVPALIKEMIYATSNPT